MNRFANAGPKPEAAPVDVLAVMDRAAYELHDYTPGAAQPMREARATVAELIEASRTYFDRYCVDEAEDYFDHDEERGENTGCTRQQHKDARRLRAALASIGGGGK